VYYFRHSQRHADGTAALSSSTLSIALRFSAAHRRAVLRFFVSQLRRACVMASESEGFKGLMQRDVLFCILSSQVKFFPTPVGTPGGKPQRLTASAKKRALRPYFPTASFAGGAPQNPVSSKSEEKRSSLGSSLGSNLVGALVTQRRGKSPRRRAPRPAAGHRRTP
jgi:hypothetical protein